MSEVKEAIDVVVGYTKQLIDAATPVAKQAYEIGLTTLKIDAAATLVSWVTVMVLGSLFLSWIRKEWVAAKADLVAKPCDEGFYKSKRTMNDVLYMGGFLHVVAGGIAAIFFTGAIFALLDVWLWVKLFAPDLWLAHMAIEKIVS